MARSPDNNERNTCNITRMQQMIVFLSYWRFKGAVSLHINKYGYKLSAVSSPVGLGGLRGLLGSASVAEVCTGDLVALYPLGHFQREGRFAAPCSRLFVGNSQELADDVLRVAVDDSLLADHDGPHEVILWCDEAVLHEDRLRVPVHHLQIRLYWCIHVNENSYTKFLSPTESNLVFY